MKVTYTPKALAQHISLQLRETDTPKLTYDDWTTIKRALHSLDGKDAEPTEEQVLRGARVIANSPLIDAHKLSAPAWTGLARAVLDAAMREEPRK